MIITFTGKRPTSLYGYNNTNNIYPWVTTAIATALRTLIMGLNEPIEVRTGGAQGADMLAFDAAETLKQEGFNLRNVLYLPFPEQSDRWPERGYFTPTVWRKHIDLADDVNYVYPDNTGNIVGKLMGRNTAMIRGADRLAAIVKTPMGLDGIKGGTGQAIRTAKSLQIPITLIRFGGTDFKPNVSIELGQY